MAQPKVIMYSKNYCPYCVRAKRMFETKGVEFEERNIDGDFEQIQRLMQETKWRTFPQIYIGEKFIGGFDDMATLDRSGELDHLLGL